MKAIPIVAQTYLSTTCSGMSALARHLVDLGAPRAASRLSSSDSLLPTSIHEPTKAASVFAVDRSLVRTVFDKDSASAFAATIGDAAGRPGTDFCASFDAEWRPDIRGGAKDHAPSLVQIGLRDNNTGGGDSASVAPLSVSVWLLDLELLKDEARTITLGALEALLTSEHIIKLGFGAQADVDKLATLYVNQSSTSAFLASGATRIVDLRDVCKDASASTNSEVAVAKASRATNVSAGGGLASILYVWTGGARTLNKQWQCSDWAARPLCQAQLDYAAADAACLFVLNDALCERIKPRGSMKFPERSFLPKVRKPNAFVPPGALLGSGRQCGALDTIGSDSSSGLSSRSSALDIVQELVAQVAPPGSCRIVNADESPLLSLESSPSSAEINAIGLIVGSGNEPVVALLPADLRLDLRWLALVLGVSRKQVRLAPMAEVEEYFGAKPGAVPPVPLRKGVRALCHPALLACDESQDDSTDDAGASPACWVGSTGNPGWRLVIGNTPTQTTGSTLQLLWQSGLGGGLQVLPDPSLYHADLDACLDFQRARGLGEGGAMNVQVCLDGALSAVARKLRMIGVDAVVAGEVLRTSASSTATGSGNRDDGAESTPRSRSYARKTTGVGRVRVDGLSAEAHWRTAVLEGRLLVATSHGNKALQSQNGGGVYRMLAPVSNPGAQFSELLEVLGLNSVPTEDNPQNGMGWGSRCGICNSGAWETLDAQAAFSEGMISEQVWQMHARSATPFYRCGYCAQVFWPGEKYSDTMTELRDLALAPSNSVAP